MERHLVQDADSPTRRSKDKAAKPLKPEDLELATGAKGPVVSGVEEIKPGDSKRLWGAVFSGKVAPSEKAGTPADVATDKTRKKSAPKSAARPGAKKARRGSEQPSS
jgi:hypothetical protein